MLRRLCSALQLLKGGAWPQSTVCLGFLLLYEVDIRLTWDPPAMQVVISVC